MDVSLLEGTLAPMEELAREIRRDKWLNFMDAGFSNPGVIDHAEAGGAVPFVEDNPKNSNRLQALKDAARAVTDLSKKTIKQGLAADEWKAWLGETRAISEKQGARVPVEEKKVPEGNPAEVRGHGAGQGSRPVRARMEKKLRNAVIAPRREILNHSTHKKSAWGTRPSRWASSSGL